MKTKGKFQVSVKTTAGMWQLDKEWLKIANPSAGIQEKRREELDLKQLEKRRYGRVLKNMAMEQTYKIKVKLPNNGSFDY